MDLLPYRRNGDTDGLLQAVVAASSVPVVSAGSIDSYERITSIWDAGAWGFTIGSAFFDTRFVPGSSFRPTGR
jgi:NAD(P)H-dependent flavin oxidoreductase YrpB (nitropropane dioxygenase family)